MTRIYTTPFAAIGDREPLTSTDPGTGKVSLPTGWSPDYEKEDTDVNYRPVGRLEMNGILYEISEALGEVQQFGFVSWQALAGGWPSGATVRNNGILWMSTANNNTTVPGAAGATWIRLNLSGVSHATFAEVDSLTSDQGPIVVTDMGCSTWLWTETEFFSGYRNPLCGDIPQSFAPSPRAWEIAVTGGIWLESDPKHRRLIALFRERGQTVASTSWTAGWGHIASLGGGSWRSPDLRNVFLRMAGTDADTANAMQPGSYQADAMQRITGTFGFGANGFATFADGAFLLDYAVNTSATMGSNPASARVTFDTSRVVRTSTETRGAATRTLPVTLI